MVTYITLAVLAVMILLVVLAFIAGLVKGLCKTSVKTICLAVGVVIFVYFTPSITNAIGNIDFSSFNITLTISETTVAVSSLQQTLVDIISATNLISPINGLSIYETAIALVNSVLSYVVFFVCVLLLQLFIWLINAIVYNLIFRWFLPVETKKERKARKAREKEDYYDEDLLDGLQDEDGDLDYDEDDYDEPIRKKWKLHRGWGGLIGAVSEAVLVFILFAPFSSLLKTVNNNRDSVDDALVAFFGEDTAATYSGYLDDLYNSALFSVLNLSDIDMQIMNKVSSVEMGGQTVSFDGLLSSLVDVANPLISNGSVSYSQATGQVIINYSVLLSNTTVDALVESILDNNMITALLPAVIDVAVNTLASDSLPLGSLDFTNIDWTSELTAINSAYQEIYETGLVTGLFAEDDPYTLTLDSFCIDASELTDESIAYYVNALDYLGSMEVVQKNMPIIMSGVASLLVSKGYDILPTDQASYESIDWGTELGLLGEVALKLCRWLDLDISADMDTSTLTSDVVAAVKDEDSRAELETILLGDTDSETGAKGLLDMQLMDVIDIPKAMSEVTTSVTSLAIYFESVDFEAALGDFTAEDLKSEFEILFDIADILFDPDAALNLQGGLSALTENFDFTDQNVANELVDVLDLGEKSVIYNSVFPEIMKSFIFNTDMNIEDYMFGLTPYDFNFDSDDFTSTLKDIIALMPALGDMLDLMNNGSASTEEIISGLDVDAICQLLEIVVNSDAFNASKTLGVTGHATENINVYTILNTLFSTDTFAEIGLSCPSISTFDGVNWETEIDYIGEMIKGAQANTSILLDFTNGDIEDVDQFENMLYSGLSSEILAPSIIEIINNSLDQFLDQLGIHMSLNDMRTSMWKEDVDEIVDILLLYETIDFDDLLNELDQNTLNVLLTSLYDCNFVTYCLDMSDVMITNDNTEEELALRKYQNFSHLTYTIIETSGLLEEIGIEYINSGLFYSEVWSTQQDEGYISLYNFDEDHNRVNKRLFAYTTSGDIAAFADFFGYISDVGIDNITGGQIPDGFLTGLPDSFYESSLMLDFLSECIYHAVNMLDIDDDYKDAIYMANLPILSSLTTAQIRYEFYVMQSLLDFVYSNDEEGNAYDHSLLQECSSNILNLYGVFGEDSKVPEKFFSLLELIGTSKIFTTVQDNCQRSAIAELIYQMLVSTEVGTDDDGNTLTLLHYATGSNNDISKLNRYIDAQFELVSDWEDEMVLFVDIIRNLQGIDNFSDILSESNGTNGVDENTLLNIFNDMNYSYILHRVPSSILQEYFNGADFEELLVDPDTGEIAYEIDLKVHLSMAPNYYLSSTNYWANELKYVVKILFEFKSFFTDDAAYSDYSMSSMSFSDISASTIYYFGMMETFEDCRSYIVYNLALRTIEDPENNEVDSADQLLMLEEVFIDSELKPWGENQRVFRIEDLLFRNEKLMVDGVLDEELVTKDLQSVQQVISDILENIYRIGINDLASLASALGEDFFETMAQDTYYFTTETYTVEEYKALGELDSSARVTEILDENNSVTGYEVTTFDFATDEEGNVTGLPERSDLASELVAGVMKRILSNDNLSLDALNELLGTTEDSAEDESASENDSASENESASETETETETTSLDFYSDDHFLANGVEGEAVDDFLVIFTYFTAVTEESEDEESGEITSETIQNSSYEQDTFADLIAKFNIAYGLEGDWKTAYSATDHYKTNGGDSDFAISQYEILANIPFAVTGDYVYTVGSGSYTYTGTYEDLTLPVTFAMLYPDYDIEENGFLDFAAKIRAVTIYNVVDDAYGGLENISGYLN